MNIERDPLAMLNLKLTQQRDDDDIETEDVLAEYAHLDDDDIDDDGYDIEEDELLEREFGLYDEEALIDDEDEEEDVSSYEMR